MQARGTPGRHPDRRRQLLVASAVVGALLVGGGAGVAYVSFRATNASSASAPGSAARSTVSDAREAHASAVEARIRLPDPGFRLATGAGSVWVLTRAPKPAVWRVDPHSNEVVGKPTPLPVDPWDLAVGFGSVWVAPNGADGRITRIDARSGRITGRISARPIYFGGEIAVGGGYVWIGNDDERYMRGSTVSKIDPATNKLVGEPIALGSPQSLAYGAGALWDADHAGWLVKIDPSTLEVSARRRLDFGPHGVLVREDAVYVADSHANRLLEANPNTADIRRVVELSIGPIYPVYAFGSIWTSSEAAWHRGVRDDRVARIDPETLSVVETLHVGGSVSAVAAGFGSVWATLQTGDVVRIRPAATR
jgi:DNA-binding beta-propeller fold protein YncE